jgi:hypothetical protein
MWQGVNGFCGWCLFSRFGVDSCVQAVGRCACSRSGFFLYAVGFCTDPLGFVVRRTWVCAWTHSVGSASFDSLEHGTLT